MVAWLAMWTLGGALAIFVFLWNLAGREIVTITRSALSLRKDILGLGRTSEFDLAHVRNFRVSPIAFSLFSMSFAQSLQFWGFGGGLLAFDYGSKTYRLGAGVDEAEASALLHEIEQRLPVRESSAV